MAARLGPGTIAALLASVALLGAAPARSDGQGSVSLHASFTPDRLGASTTIGFSFRISPLAGELLPPPLAGMSLRLPPGIDYATTTLGLAVCEPAALRARGLAGCSPNSRLGHGSAFVEVPFGSSRGYEIPDIEALMGPPRGEDMVVLFYADGREPVYAQLVFEAELIQGSATVGGQLNTAVPLIPSVPGGPPVAIVSVDVTIGPRGLTYYERVHGRTVRFHPTGVSVPDRCPRGGFPFSALVTFQDGTSSTARTAVPCPRRRRR